MARIADETIERIKREVPIAERVEAFGVELKAHGADRIGHCPFHADRTPSLVVSPSKNLWHCLGACQTGGSVIDWVMRTEGLSFRDAAEKLAGELPGANAAVEPVIEFGETGAEAPDDAALLDRVIGFYHRTLLEAPEALDYLRRRGLDHPELISTFRLGYANRTLGLRLPKKKLKAGRELRARLQSVGMLRASGHEHFNGCLVVPVIDEAGQVAEVYGRKLRDDLRPGTAYHLYRPGPHAGVWNVSALAATDEVILCESLIDAMTFWCAGYRHVTASYGTGGFTTEHLEAFTRHGIRRVLIAYDADAAGDEAAEAHAGRLGEAGIAAFRVRFARGEDANSTAAASDDPSAVLGDALRAAEWLEGSAAPPHPASAVPADGAEPNEGEDEALPGLSDLDEPAADAESDPVPPQAPASPLPPPPSAPELPCEVTDTEVRLAVGDRGYRVRGLDTNGAEAMKINLRVHRGAGDDLAFHLDTLDLYQAKARRAYTAAAAEAVGVEPAVIERDLGRVLLQLESVQESRRQAAARPQEKEPELTESERDAALAWLREPGLIARLRADLARSGVVGETTNTLVAYLVATSRLLARPLALIVQSSSAAGKSSLLEAVLALFPEAARAQYAALTGQSLYYLGEHELSHRILAVAEEEGAAQATYALKLLQSEGRLTIASTGKDPTTGNLQTQQYRVEGPVALMLTTTAAELDAELANRCLVVGIDEDRSQTAAIQAEQRRRRTRAGLEAARERDHIRNRHHAIQQMLEPVAVVNPYAERLTFAAEPTRTRRDHEKYLTLIEAIALLHQHQRPIHTLGDDDEEDGEAVRYIEATLDDIALANELAHAVLGRTLDELPPQTRRLLGEIQRFVEEDRQAKQIERADYRFSRRELRSATGWGDTQLKVHLSRLVELEYLLVHRQGPRFVYELVFDGTADAGAAPHCNGLIDVAALQADPDRSAESGNRSGDTANRSGSGRAGVGSQSDDGEDPESAENAFPFSPLAADVSEAVGISPDARPEPKNHHRPYTPTGVLS